MTKSTTKLVYHFSEGDKDQKDLLGGKGANLAEMTRLGLPVPPGFIITTEACRSYLEQGRQPDQLRVQVTMALRRLEDEVGRRLGDSTDPLLVSVRSGAKFSMPGMMETVLNVGLNDCSVIGLAEASGDERFAWDSYRRLIQMFGKTVLGVEGEAFGAALDAAKKRKGVKTDVELEAEDLQELVEEFKKIIVDHTGEEFPQDPRHQLDLATRSVFDSWNTDRAALPPARADPARPRHRGERLHDGVRQPGRDLRHRRLLHPGPGDGQARCVRRLPGQRAGRRRRLRDPQHAVARRLREVDPESHEQLARSCAGWRPTTATCATSSSRSSAASSGCCRPGSASAPRRQPSGSPPSWSTSS